MGGRKGGVVPPSAGRSQDRGGTTRKKVGTGKAIWGPLMGVRDRARFPFENTQGPRKDGKGQKKKRDRKVKEKERTKGLVRKQKGRRNSCNSKGENGGQRCFLIVVVMFFLKTIRVGLISSVSMEVGRKKNSRTWEIYDKSSRRG